MQSPPKESYTILRIKRKRTDEPIDALVIETISKRRKSRAPLTSNITSGSNENEDDAMMNEGEERDVFQFAETVEADIWTDKTSVEAMHDRISAMARKVTPIKHSIPYAESPPTQFQPKTNAQTFPPRRYTIVNQPHPKSKSRDSSPRKSSLPASPPIVRSARELKEERARERELEMLRETEKSEGFTMYEAVRVGEDRGDGEDVMLENDPEMASFLPMLQEYLRINDINIYEMPTIGRRPSLPFKEDEGSNDDYVWDVFIHRSIPLETWNQVALLGSVTGVPGDDSYPSDESEIEDEADEDSNDENWYANDYPDEEVSEEDELFQRDEREW